MSESLQVRDLRHIWHPCSQMKDYETFLPLPIQRARGSYFELTDGRKLIDAIASWWCKSFGHGHPVLRQALVEQAEQFEHVIFANTCQPNAVALSEKLARLAPGLDKVFYAGDGSCAIEVAMKMSIHANRIRGQHQRTRFMALENSYHGETVLTLSVSDLGLYKAPYEALYPPTTFLRGIPYVSGSNDPLWHDCSEQWPALELQLDAQKDSLSAIIVEPILQGAGGMKVYSPDFLRRLREWTTANDIHLIADEILTGMGRLGEWLGCDLAGITADFVCVSKGLTAGWLPLSAVLTSNKIYQLFYADYEQGKSFLHSHTYSGNALAIAVANAVVDLLEKEQMFATVKELNRTLTDAMVRVAESTGKLTNIRSVGAMVAADLCVDQQHKRVGYAVFKRAVERGAFLRPLGNTLYWFPPFTIEPATLTRLETITRNAIDDVMG